MKNWEWEFIDNKCWGLGFWFLPSWFGCQIWKYRLVIRKKSDFELPETTAVHHKNAEELRKNRVWSK